MSQSTSASMEPGPSGARDDIVIRSWVLSYEDDIRTKLTGEDPKLIEGFIRSIEQTRSEIASSDALAEAHRALETTMKYSDAELRGMFAEFCKDVGLHGMQEVLQRFARDSRSGSYTVTLPVMMHEVRGAYTNTLGYETDGADDL